MDRGSFTSLRASLGGAELPESQLAGSVQRVSGAQLRATHGSSFADVLSRTLPGSPIELQAARLSAVFTSPVEGHTTLALLGAQAGR